MKRRRGRLLTATVVSVHVVDAVRAVVHAHGRCGTVVIDREDYGVVHDVASVGHELDNEARPNLVVQQARSAREGVLRSLAAQARSRPAGSSASNDSGLLK